MPSTTSPSIMQDFLQDTTTPAAPAAIADDSLLEPKYSQAFRTWETTPNPQTTGRLLQQLKPVVNKALTSYVPGKPGPLMRSQAKQLTLDALQSYDPRQSKLQTHLLTRLQRLRRQAAKQSQIISMPERLMLERNALKQAELEFEDDYGREATAEELADHTGFSTKRIAKIRGLPIATSGSEATAAFAGGDPAVQQQAGLGVAEFVYDDLSSARDRLIMEYSLGLHGRKKLSKTEIARKLGVTPGAVTQRTQKIQHMIDQVVDSGLING